MDQEPQDEQNQQNEPAAFDLTAEEEAFYNRFTYESPDTRSTADPARRTRRERRRREEQKQEDFQDYEEEEKVVADDEPFHVRGRRATRVIEGPEDPNRAVVVMNMEDFLAGFEPSEVVVPDRQRRRSRAVPLIIIDQEDIDPIAALDDFLANPDQFVAEEDEEILRNLDSRRIIEAAINSGMLEVGDITGPNSLDEEYHTERVRLVSDLKKLITKSLNFEVSSADRQEIVDCVKAVLSYFTDPDARGYYFELFKFFYSNNIEAKNQATNFYLNFNTWKGQFQRYVVLNANLPENTRNQFNAKSDVLLYRLSAMQVEGCISLVQQTMVERLEEFPLRYHEPILKYIKEGMFVESRMGVTVGGITIIEPEIIPVFRGAVTILVGLFIICRVLWSFNVKMVDLLRNSDRYYRKLNNNQRYIEVFPYLITQVNNVDQYNQVGDDMHTINTINVSQGVSQYVIKYLKDYDIMSMIIKVSLKRVLYMSEERDPTQLGEAYWVVYLNPFTVVEDFDEDENLLLDFNSMVEIGRKRGSIRDIEVGETNRRNAARFNILKTRVDDDDLNWETWLIRELQDKIEKMSEKYQSQFIDTIGPFPYREECFKGLMISSYVVNAKCVNNGRVNIQRISPVHCKSALRHSFYTLASHRDVLPSLGGLCLWQAHWTALNKDNMSRSGVFRKISSRQEALLRDFSALPKAHQEIFMLGDIYKYRTDIQPANITTIIYEIDDPVVMSTRNNNIQHTTPIACWDGHAVCSSWDKVVEFMTKAFMKDNKTDEDGDSERRGKRITWLAPFEEAEIEEGCEIVDYFLDIETYDKTNVVTGLNMMIPYLIVVVSAKLNYPKVWWGNSCVEDFLRWFESIEPRVPTKKSRGVKKQIRNIWGYNSYKFDFIPFVRSLAAWEKFSLQGTLTNIKTLKVGDTTFYDLLRIIPFGSLAKQAKVWKTAHQKMDFDHNIVNEAWLDNISNDDKLKAVKYCINDCVVLKEVFDAYKAYTVTQFKVNPYVYSAAALGFNVWRTNMAYSQLKLQGVDQGLYPIFNASYKGGMVFMTSKVIPPNTPFLYMYDINSSYPAAMSKYEMPLCYQGHYDWPENKLKEVKEEDIVITNCYQISNLEYRDLWLPLTPKRTMDGLRYELKPNPVEYIWGVELLEVIRTRKVINGSIGREHRFSTGPIYKAFVNDLYKRRLEAKLRGDEIATDYLKLLLNSTYGKKAQQLYPTSVICDSEKFLYLLSLNADNIDIANTEDLGGGLYHITFTDLKYSKQVGSNVHVAAFITAAARAEMTRAVRISTDNYRKPTVIYGDTDSLVLTEPLPDDMIHADKLGYWKLEHKFVDWKCLGAKMYYAEKDDGSLKMRFKGVPRESVTKELFDELLTNGEAVVNSGLIWKRHKDGFVHKLQTNKKIIPKDKRIFLNNYTSIPF